MPTIAIEKVEIYNNTSLFQDDFLSHRLGLIPLDVDPQLFDFPNDKEEDPNKIAKQKLIFELKIKCTYEKSKSKTDGKSEVLNRRVLSKFIKWVPLEGQENMFERPPVPVLDDILIAKLSPGQEMDLRLVCVKGIGRDHAKFSPVSTAAYRLLPKIEILRDVRGQDADLVKESFSKGVIEITGEGDQRQAKVVDSRKDMCSRNIFRHDHLSDAVKMTLIKDHFICE